MRALRLHSYGAPPAIEQVDDPKISGPLDVIVEIAAAGVCRTDLHIIAGQLASAGTPLPLTLGHENVGWVRDVGSAVSNVALGDLVLLHPTPTCGLCRSCRSGYDMLCTDSTFPGVFHDGGMAELMATNARSCVRLPPDTDPVQVAAQEDAGLTAYHAVKRALPFLPPGAACVVLGIGGLGHIAVQCLVALSGARIIAIDEKPAALELALELGVHDTVVAGSNDVDAVRELTGGEGVEVVLDLVGEAGAERKSPQMLRRGGHYFVVGYGGTLEIPTFDIILNEISIVGNLVGSYQDLTELVALQALGKVRLHTVAFALDDARDALNALEAGAIAGRAVLVP